MIRIATLMNGKRKRRYPLPDDVELKDEYWIDGERWTVVMVATVTHEMIETPLARTTHHD